MSTVYLLLNLLLTLIFSAFVCLKIFYLLVCCLIRAVLHPVLSAASDPGLELYRNNINFRSRILFKRISYAYSSALENSDLSVFFLFKLFVMAIDSNVDPFLILY